MLILHKRPLGGYHTHSPSLNSERCLILIQIRLMKSPVGPGRGRDMDGACIGLRGT